MPLANEARASYRATAPLAAPATYLLRILVLGTCIDFGYRVQQAAKQAAPEYRLSETSGNFGAQIQLLIPPLPEIAMSVLW